MITIQVKCRYLCLHSIFGSRDPFLHVVVNCIVYGNLEVLHLFLENIIPICIIHFIFPDQSHEMEHESKPVM